MIRFIPLLIGHVLLWAICAREALIQPELTKYIKVRRDEAQARARLLQEDEPERRTEYGTEEVEWDHARAATTFINSGVFRPLMIIQLLLFQTTNVLAPAYFSYVTYKLQYARSHGPIYAIFAFFLGALFLAAALIAAPTAFYSLMHYAMLGLWYPLVVAMMIYSAQDRLEAQPERLGADRKQRRGVPRPTSRL